MAKKTYRQMSSMNVEDMTVKQLKSYIREMTVRVAYNTRSSMKAVSSHAKYIINEFGTYRRKGKTYVRLGFSGARKSALIEKAQALRSFAKTYATNFENRKKKNTRHSKAYDSFVKNHGYVSEDEYDKIFTTMNELGTLFKEEGSPLINLYYEFRNHKGFNVRTFVDIVKEVMSDLAGEGTHEDVIDEVYRRLQKMYY